MIISMWNVRTLILLKPGFNVLKRQLRNMDETGFQMGVTSTAKVVCGFKIKQKLC